MGSTPIIDGVFEEGEWDDAEVIQAGEYRQFRIKHDRKNLYFALVGGGGDLWFKKDTVLHILHSSAQLGFAEYVRSDSSVHSLARPFSYTLWGLQTRPANEIQEAMTDYLAVNGWTASIAPMGEKRQTEFAVSFEWLGVAEGKDRFVRIPDIYVYSGMILGPDDPLIQQLMAMSLEERKTKYPTLYWPTEKLPHEVVGRGKALENLRLDPAEWGTIWIDLGRR